MTSAAIKGSPGDTSNLMQWIEAMSNMNAIIRKETTQISRMEGYKYQDQESLLLAEGQEFDAVYEPFTNKEHDYLYQVIKRIRRTWHFGECFMNAFILADWPDSEIRYVEGLATNSTIPMNHAWGVFNGKVIDLTWIHQSFYDEDDHEKMRLKHNRMRAPAKLLVRMDSLRKDPEVQYVGVYIPVESLYKGMMRQRVYYSILQDWEEKWPLQKEGLPKDWSQES